MSAGTVVDDGVVNALDVTVHESTHWQCLFCLPIATWASFFVAAMGSRLTPILPNFHSSPSLVKVVRVLTRFLFLWGLDYLHESTSVFPCNGDNLQPPIFRLH